MSRCWLLLDVSFLCHRAFHSTGNLSFEGVGTGVLYGLLRDVTNLQETFSTKHVVFAFDSPNRKLKRQEIYPAYKSNRKPFKDEGEAKLMGELRRQIGLLRDDYLPQLGYKNVLHAEGYEADDVIASVCQNIPSNKCPHCQNGKCGYDHGANCEDCGGAGQRKDRAIIVSSDKDLWQLLSPNVSMWNPRTKKMMTVDSFRGEWGLHPREWAHVKALAGCDGDNVTGIKGVGEKTAAKYYRGDLNEGSKANKAIESDDGIATEIRNLPLVKLPYPGTPAFSLQEDHVKQRDWDKLMQNLGMKSLVGRIV